MAEPVAEPKPEAPPTQPDASPLDQLSETFERYEKQASDDVTPPEPKPEPPAKDWEKIAREAEERAEKNERRLRELEAERAVSRVVTPPANVAEPTPPDARNSDPRWKQVDELFWTDNQKAREIEREIYSDDQRRIVREELQAAETAREAARATETRGREAVNAATVALPAIMTEYSVTRPIAEAMMQRAFSVIAQHVERTGDSSVWLVPENYKLATTSMFPLTEAQGTVPPPPVERGDPPGPKGSAPPAPRREVRAPLSPETDRSLSMLASAVGLSSDAALRFKSKVASTKG